MCLNKRPHDETRVLVPERSLHETILSVNLGNSHGQGFLKIHFISPHRRTPVRCERVFFRDRRVSGTTGQSRELWHKRFCAQTARWVMYNLDTSLFSSNSYRYSYIYFAQNERIPMRCWGLPDGQLDAPRPGSIIRLSSPHPPDYPIRLFSGPKTFVTLYSLFRHG